MSRFRLVGTAKITSFGQSASNRFQMIQRKKSHIQNSSTSLDCHIYFSSNMKTITFQTCDAQSQVKDPILIGFNSEIRLDVVEQKSYLNVANGNSHNWSRLWCSLYGCTMKFWSDKQFEQVL